MRKQKQAPDVDWAPLSHPRYVRCSTLRLANLANVDCLGLAGLLAGADLELDSIALIKGLEAVHLDGAKVNEDIGLGIRRSVIRSDEAVTLLAEERFLKCTGCHAANPFYLPLDEPTARKGA